MEPLNEWVSVLLHSFYDFINAQWDELCWQILNHSPQKNSKMQFCLIQAVNPSICVHVPDLRHDVYTTLVLVLLPVILCSQTGLRHAVCDPPGTPRGSDLVPLSLQWQFSPSLLPHKKKRTRPGNNYGQQKEQRSGFPVRQRLPTPASIWQVPVLWRQTWARMSGVTFSKCHMSSEFYVTLQTICQGHKKSLHPRIMLYRVKIIINIILFRAKWRIEGIYEHLCKNIPSDAFKSFPV